MLYPLRGYRREEREFFSFFCVYSARTLGAPPNQGGWEGVNKRAQILHPKGNYRLRPIETYREYNM